MLITPNSAVPKLSNRVTNGLSLRPRHRKRRAEQHGEDNDLHQVARCKRVDRIFGKHRYPRVDAMQGGLLGHGRRRLHLQVGDVDTDSEVEDVHHEKAECQGARGDHLKVEERLEANNSSFLQVAGLRYAAHHGHENDRTDHHLHESDEYVREGLQLDSSSREKVTRQNAQDHSDEHLVGSAQIPLPFGRDGTLCVGRGACHDVSMLVVVGHQVHFLATGLASSVYGITKRTAAG